MRIARRRDNTVEGVLFGLMTARVYGDLLHCQLLPQFLHSRRTLVIVPCNTKLARPCIGSRSAGRTRTVYAMPSRPRPTLSGRHAKNAYRADSSRDSTRYIGFWAHTRRLQTLVSFRRFSDQALKVNKQDLRIMVDV